MRLIIKKFEKVLGKFKIEVTKLREMLFALAFRSQRKFFVDLIMPGEPRHQENFEKFWENSKVLK